MLTRCINYYTDLHPTAFSFVALNCLNIDVALTVCYFCNDKKYFLSLTMVMMKMACWALRYISKALAHRVRHVIGLQGGPKNCTRCLWQ